MHAESIAKAMEVFMSSQREIDAFHLEKMSKMVDSQVKAVSILELSADR